MGKWDLFDVPWSYAAGAFEPFRTVSEEAFYELRQLGVLGSSVSIALIVWAAMWLGSEVGGGILHLATAVHIVELVGTVVVLAFTAMELIPLPVS
jgi:hypothetical protein